MYIFLMVSVAAVAQEAVVVPQSAVPPEWLTQLLVFAESLPYVGPAMIFIMKWAGFLSVLLTAVSVFVEGVKVAVVQSFKWAGFEEKAAKIEAMLNKVLPYLKYLSMLNVQKKK